MACNCNEGKTYNIGMGCCVPTLAPIENYYTKSQVDELIEGIEVSGVTEEELDEKIASAKTEIENEIPTVPTSNTAFTNDAGYLTENDLKGVVQPMQQDIVNLETAVSGKQETLSAGTNISISNNVISATDTTYSAGDGIQISGNTISTTTKFQCLTEQEWASVSGNPDTNTVYFIR